MKKKITVGTNKTNAAGGSRKKSIENKGVQPVRCRLISINYYFNDYYYYSQRPVLMFNHHILSSNSTKLSLNTFLLFGLLKKVSRDC